MDDWFKVILLVLLIAALFGWSACGGGDPAEPSWTVVYDLRDAGSE